MRREECSRTRVGMICVSIFNDVLKESLDKYKYAVIKDLFVKKEYRGKGIGTTLINHVIYMCNKKGIFCIELGVSGGNERALRFYEKNGFKVNHYNLRMNLKEGVNNET